LYVEAEENIGNPGVGMDISEGAVINMKIFNHEVQNLKFSCFFSGIFSVKDMFDENEIGNVRINVILRRVHLTIVAVEKQ
jgi:hypothetical protein